MKFLCSHCDVLAEVDRFRVDGATLVLACSRCGNESRTVRSSATPVPQQATSAVAAAKPGLALSSSPQASNIVELRTPSSIAAERAAEAAKGDPFNSPEGRCPKCVAVRPADAPNCSQCGLVFAQFAPQSLVPPEWLSNAWLELLRNWSNEEKHRLLRDQAVARDELVALARLYRIRLADQPDDPLALKGRDSVVQVVVAPMIPSDASAENVQRVRQALAVFVMLVLLGAVVWLVRFIVRLT